MKKNEMGGAFSMCGERRGVYRILVGRREAVIPHGKPRHRWRKMLK